MAGPWDDYQSSIAEVSGGPWQDYTKKTIVDRAAPTVAAPSVGDRILHGVGDVGVGLIQLATRGERLLNPGVEPSSISQYVERTVDKAAQEREQRYQQSRGPDPSTDWWRGAGEVAGALPIAALTGGAGGLPGAVLSGAASGAAQPVTEGNFLSEKLKQAGIGAAFGAAGSAVGKLAGAAANKVGGWLGWVDKNVPDATQSKAVQTLLGRFAQDAKTGGPTAEQAIDLVRTANAEGKPMTLADVGGANVKSLTGSIYRKGGEAKNQLAMFLKGREAGAGERLTSDVEGSLGGGVSTKQAIDALSDARAHAAAPLYDEAFAANRNMASTEIDSILETPAGARALKEAATKMRNDRTLVGRPDPELLDQAREAEQYIPFKGGIASGLKLRTLDYVKRSLDDQIGAAVRSGEKDNARVLTGLKNALVREMDALDVTAQAGPNSLKPDGGAYARARAAYSGPSRSIDAAEEGGRFMSKDPRDVADEIANLNPNDRQFYKLGAANALIKNLPRLRRLDQINQDRLVDQLRPLFDSDADFQHFISKAESEGQMLATQRSVMGGSQTAERVAEDRGFDRAITGAHAALQAGNGNVVGAAINALKTILPDLSPTRSLARNAAMAKLLTMHNPVLSAPPQQPQEANALMRMLPAVAGASGAPPANSLQ